MEKPQESIQELDPLLASLSLAFWRTRLFVEREAGTLPLKLMILTITQHKEGIHPKELNLMLGLDLSRLSRLTQSLEREGLLHRERDQEDRRLLRLYPTQKGLVFLRERVALINGELARRLGDLDKKELEELARMLSEVAERMRP